MVSESLLTRTVLAAARQESSTVELRCRALLDRAATSRRLQSALQRELALAGLTEAGFTVLTVLRASEPQAVLRSDLGSISELSPMRADDALSRLEASQLVQRTRDPADRRLILLRLTAAGREQVERALARYVSAAATVTREIDDADLTAGLTVSEKLRRGASSLNAEKLFPTRHE